VSNVATDQVNNAFIVEAECSKVGGNFCTDMEVTGFPTLVLVFKGKYMKYTGGRTHGAMTEFLADDSKWNMQDLPAKISQFLPAPVAASIDEL
jgi:hypothetical protein